MRKKGAACVALVCMHVTQAVADSLVFLQEFEVTYICHSGYSTYLSHKKLCKTNSFHGLVIGLLDFFMLYISFARLPGFA